MDSKGPLGSMVMAFQQVLRVLTCICMSLQLAVSTRPNEYKAYTGFISAEDGEMGKKAFFSGLVSQRARRLVLHGVGNRNLGLAEADSQDDDTPLTPVKSYLM
jgi:hypothetical protein